MRASSIATPIRRFARDERGVISVWSLFLFVTICCIGAAAVDVTHLYAARTQLQAAADIAAHSALYTRRYGNYSSADEAYYPLTDNEAKAAAIAVVEFGMPPSIYGTVIDADQIILGNWDHATGTVVPDTEAPFLEPDAAMAITDQAVDNPVSTFLFRIIGIKEMDVAAQAVFVLAFEEECRLGQGFFSRTEILLRGGHHFGPGVCIVAPALWVRNDNEFQQGVSIVLPTAEDLDLSNSDPYVHNPGLMEALVTEPGPGETDEPFDVQDDFMEAELALVTTDNTTLPTNMQHFRSHDYARWLLSQANWTQVVTDPTLTAPRNITSNNTALYPTHFAANRVHVLKCTTPNAGVSLRSSAAAGNTYKNVVILTDCPVVFDGAVKLEDMILSSSHASNNRPTITAPASPQGFTIGRNDDCAPTGGAALITRGSIDTAAKPNYYGAVVRAGGYVDFQSGAVGEGVSIVAGGLLDTNSNNNITACGEEEDSLSRDVSLRLIR